MIYLRKIPAIEDNFVILVTSTPTQAIVMVGSSVVCLPYFWSATTPETKNINSETAEGVELA